jgi:hypothetical protein
MTSLQLNGGDRDLLKEILQKHLKELSWEIAFTHTKDSLELLRKRRDFIEDFIRRLSSQTQQEDKITNG